jgi:hypothetical protein
MFRMFRISPFGHVEKGAVCSRRFQISLQIPSATRAGAIMHSRVKVSQVILMESAGNMHLVVLPD